MAGDRPSTAYYTFAGHLGPELSEIYLTLPHREQIRLFEGYLQFLEAQQVQFPTSKRATRCSAIVIPQDKSQTDEIEELVTGQTISGFGVCGTEDGYLPQKELSIGAAWIADTIRHEYVVENPTVLNSRSFMFGWCHAEKQKLTHLYQNITDTNHWRRIRLIVSRDMCADCICFAKGFASHVGETIQIEDPSCVRIFEPSGSIQVSSKT